MSTSLRDRLAWVADQEEIREGVTMALYVSLSLLAVIVALPDDAIVAAPGPVIRIALTSFGLILAHVIAFRVSDRLVHRGLLSPEVARQLGAQLVGGLGVTVAATVPMMLIGGTAGVRAAEIVLVVFIAAVSYAAARAATVGRLGALGYVAGVVVLGVIVLVVKNLVPH